MFTENGGIRIKSASRHDDRNGHVQSDVRPANIYHRPPPKKKHNKYSVGPRSCGGLGIQTVYRGSVKKPPVLPASFT